MPLCSLEDASDGRRRIWEMFLAPVVWPSHSWGVNGSPHVTKWQDQSLHHDLELWKESKPLAE